ncbi:hypothetical protein M514_25779 [Trichuris suis]|uniref:Uncharacterized protein n=1 Tax=Trichuris suis TaxID=68888 RepID=A0A085MXW4_9BILA|nr:hypothetical protein M514_25779 [Trichuris suis]
MSAPDVCRDGTDRQRGNTWIPGRTWLAGELMVNSRLGHVIALCLAAKHGILNRDSTFSVRSDAQKLKEPFTYDITHPSKETKASQSARHGYSPNSSPNVSISAVSSIATGIRCRHDQTVSEKRMFYPAAIKQFVRKIKRYWVLKMSELSEPACSVVRQQDVSEPDIVAAGVALLEGVKGAMRSRLSDRLS